MSRKILLYQSRTRLLHYWLIPATALNMELKSGKRKLNTLNLHPCKHILDRSFLISLLLLATIYK
jgi:hypothetical protein